MDRFLKTSEKYLSLWEKDFIRYFMKLVEELESNSFMNSVLNDFHMILPFLKEAEMYYQKTTSQYYSDIEKCK